MLKNNFFVFDGKFYKQLQGTAMGTKLAPAYANIFMAKLEHNILSHAPLKPSFYKRYIDDIPTYHVHNNRKKMSECNVTLHSDIFFLLNSQKSYSV